MIHDNEQPNVVEPAKSIIEPQHVPDLSSSDQQLLKQAPKPKVTKKSNNTHTEDENSMEQSNAKQTRERKHNKRSQSHANPAGKGHHSTTQGDKVNGELPSVSVRLPRRAKPTRTSEEFEALDSWRSTAKKTEMAKEAQRPARQRAPLSESTKKKILNIIGEGRVLKPKHKETKQNEDIHNNSQPSEKAKEHQEVERDIAGKKMTGTVAPDKSDAKTKHLHKHHHKDDTANQSAVNTLKKTSQSKAPDKAKGGSASDDWRAKSNTPAPPTQQIRKRHPDNSHSDNKRQLFARYFHDVEVKRLLESKKLYKGSIRINKRNRQDAYVTSDDLEYDIYIHGAANRNRALEGDIVAVQLKDVDQVWEVKKKKDEKNAENKKERNFSSNAEEQREVEIIPQKIEVEEESDDEDKNKPKYCGVVVAILDRSLEPIVTGILSLDRPGNGPPKNGKPLPAPKVVWLKPTDMRMPLIAIPIAQCPADFAKDEAKYRKKIFIVRILSWPATQQHPYGMLVKELGNVGELAIEAKALLAEHNVKDSDFPIPAMRNLPETPWEIPEKEYKSRRDLRFHRIFTIDPITAKDLDDAVHITDKGDGTYEVGVHIADVSYFIPSKSALDTEALNRGTSVYLVDRVIPMLPSLLCEKLCSLNPGVERLAFSVIWQMDKEGKILDTWFGRTIIKSCAKLAYEHAQQVIEGGSLSKKIEVHAHGASEIERDIMDLYHISLHLRKARFANGALSMNSVKLSFDLDDEGKPTDVHVYQQKDANRLIEEFMLSANISVAKKIASHYPEQALLRRHAPPIERRLEEFLIQAESYGYVIDASSAGALQASFNEIESDEVRNTLLLLAIKPMQRAKYFCTGTLDITKYLHYALNVPMYTHFTSPIRRFADVIVHRQLEAALSGVDEFALDSKAIAKIAEQCNIKKDGAKNAQDASIKLYLAEYIHRQTELHGPIYCEATVIRVLEECYEVFVPEYGLEQRLYLDRMALKKSTHDPANDSIILEWQEAANEMKTVIDERIKSLQFNDDDMDMDIVMDELSGQFQNLNKGSEKLPEKDLSKRALSSQQMDQDDNFSKKQSEGEAKQGETIKQVIKIFGKVQVRIDANMERTPPIINLHAVKPPCSG